MIIEIFYGFILLLLPAIVCSYLAKSKNKNKVVFGRTIGYETSSQGGWYRRISPILEYEIDGKKYRCVMFSLSCEDTEQNRLANINREYKLFYDEKYPNRVTSSNSFNERKYLPIYLFMITIIFMILMIFDLR